MFKLSITILLLIITFLPAWTEPEVVEKVLTLSSSAVEVNFDPARPVIISYKSPSKEVKLYGSVDRLEPEIVYFDGDAGKYRSSLTEEDRIDYIVSHTDSQAIYRCRLFNNNKQAAEYELIFVVTGNRLIVTSRLLKELGNVRLCSIKLPLLSVLGNQKGASLALPSYGGRLIDVNKADPVQRVHKVNPVDITPIAMAYHDRMLGLVALSSIDDQIISQIRSDPKAGVVAVEFIRRHKAEKPELSFLVQTDTTCTVTILEPRGNDPINWTAGAAVVRDAVFRNLNSLYLGSFIYRIALDWPSAPEWTNFDEALSLIRRVKRLTGGARQIVYLTGWQGDGSDPGYPDSAAVNPHLGSIEQLKSLIQSAKLDNAIVSVRDNYRNIYEGAAGWNPSVVAWTSSGELAVEASPSNGQAYIVSPSKYVTYGSSRARTTRQNIGIERTILLDSLTNDPELIDFSQKLPAGRQASVQGRLSIISAFNQLGLDVASEWLTAPFVTKISHFWRVGGGTGKALQDSESIPLVPMIYHGKVTAGGNAATDEEMLDLLLYGWTFSKDLTKNTKDEEITDLYYLITLPWSGLAAREISGWEKKGSVEKVVYNNNTYVEVDREKNTYKVVRDGTTVASNFSTMMPMPDGKILVYSRKGGPVTVDLPEGWKDFNKIIVTRQKGDDESGYKFKGSNLILKTTPRMIYKISYK